MSLSHSRRNLVSRKNLAIRDLQFLEGEFPAVERGESSSRLTRVFLIASVSFLADGVKVDNTSAFDREV